jgi:hypothetical protein
MARFDDLPDKILRKILSYLSMAEITFSARNVCTRWRKVSEHDEIWKHRAYCPAISRSEFNITSLLKGMPALRKFMYYGTCNVMKKLSKYCTKITALNVPHIKLSPNLLKLTMKRLTELTALGISLSPTQEGLQITRIIGQSETLVTLKLSSSGENSVTEGLLKPIADGCPNLKKLTCENFNCPNYEICYLMQRKRSQLVEYRHHRLVSADLINAIKQCTNLERLVFNEAYFDGPFHNVPANTQLHNLKVFQVLKCKFPTIKTFFLTVFHDKLSQLSYVGICFAQGHIDDLIKKIIRKCPALANLDLEGNLELRCRALKNISPCKMIKYLDVSKCKELGKKAMKYVAEGCPDLEFLDVSGIPISESMFRQILRCRNLKALFMKDCDIREINLNLIPANISGLSHLYIGPQFQLRDDVKSEMMSQMPHLTIKEATLLPGITEYTLIKSKYFKQYI